MKITNESTNTLLKRTEVEGIFPSTTNPGFETVKQKLSELKKVPLENIAIKQLKNNYGANEFLIEAFIYESQDHKEKIEQKAKPKKGAAV